MKISHEYLLKKARSPAPCRGSKENRVIPLKIVEWDCLRISGMVCLFTKTSYEGGTASYASRPFGDEELFVFPKKIICSCFSGVRGPRKVPGIIVEALTSLCGD